MNKLFKCIVVGTLFFSQHITIAQDAEEIDWDNLTLEQLMNIPINSASKKDETLFDAPLSSYTITRSDIEYAGATSIMEALRLAPGVIVREQSNGNYDIHIRGLDNLLRHSETTTKANLATLVMIDNRPVFNNNLGGTFWEALPIDLNDIDRIEIVRGPSAPLFGPNAVTGVINIITRKLSKDQMLVNANLQAGTPSVTLANLSAGKNFDKLSVIFSGHYQNRERFQNTYFVPATSEYHSVDEMAAMFGEDIYQQYENPDLAADNFGANIFMDYKMTGKTNFSLSAGTQQSEVQKIFLSNALRNSIPITTSETQTSYVNVAGKVRNLSLRTSFLSGHDDLARNADPNKYDYDVFDASAEYNFEIGKIGTIVPGLSYHKAMFSDEDYATDGLVFLGGKTPEISTASAFIRSDLQPLKALRVIAALRVDKFSSPDDAYLAYEFAATYKLNANHLVRAALNWMPDFAEASSADAG